LAKFLDRYHHWRRRAFPASKEDVAWRHDFIFDRINKLDVALADIKSGISNLTNSAKLQPQDELQFNIADAIPRSRLSDQLKSWRAGIQHELRFWDLFMETRGLEWKDDFDERLRKDREINVSMFRDASTLPQDLKIIDVGAGPCTSLGSNLNGQPINLIACDPLAPFYKALAGKHGLNFPISTVQAFAEDLSSYYPEGTFDLVHCSNALDHSFDPIRGIEQMLIVAKPNGRVFLCHGLNEAEYESYAGFHQWNFDEDNGDFLIWNKQERINATEYFSAFARIETVKADRLITVIFDKTGSKVSPSRETQDSRIRELLSAMLLISSI
jgi:SAM-dependent methyltransferase